MPLVILHVGNDARRYHSEHDAKTAGAVSHSVENPAKIEITPDGGGLVTTLAYDGATGVWVEQSD